MRTLALLLLAAFVVGDVGRIPRDVRTDLFTTALVCGSCHSTAADSGTLLDARGRGIGPYDLWRSSMMANSARDPFFRAAVAAEGEAAEASCMRCHAPMASIEYGHKLKLAHLDQEDDETEENRAALARDGVSCTLCHQITADNAGKPESFDGRFVVNEDKEIYGPFDNQFGLPMQRITKYWPIKGEHLMKSEHCASCHTQRLTGGAYELATFLEWRNSDHVDRNSCQSCHVPQDPVRTRIARTNHGGDILTLAPRGPIGLHTFVGGNTLIPAILRDNIDALHVKAPPEAFDATIKATRKLLEEQTAHVAIEEATRDDDQIHIVVSVANRSGHKFPTGHASRRAWLRVRALDHDHKVVWTSGEVDQAGRLLGVAAGVIPHRNKITKAQQVQVYEAVLGDAQGKPVFTSTAARGFAKDNRLLPTGWKAKHADGPATKPVGIGDDEDFVAGSDRITYEIPFPTDSPTFTLEVELLFQPLGARHAAELFKSEHAEVKRFRGWYEQADRTPVVISRARIVGGEE